MRSAHRMSQRVHRRRPQDHLPRRSSRAQRQRAPKTPPSTPPLAHPFADVQGWIAYGDDEGIWAIDPTHGGRPKPILLSDELIEPAAWSRDGSKLLIIRRFISREGRHWANVSLLNADGVEKRVVRMNGYGFASLSPDGLQILYSTTESGIHLADADGGDARLLKARDLTRPGRRMAHASRTPPGKGWAVRTRSYSSGQLTPAGATFRRSPASSGTLPSRGSVAPAGGTHWRLLAGSWLQFLRGHRAP